MKLFIDTATKYLLVGLYDKEVVDLVKKEGHNDHSKTLMVEIESIFERNKVKLSDIEEIIIGEGPGSYTGVRIGVVVAKTLAHFNNIPLRKVSSLEVIASSQTGVTAVAIDASRGNVFCAVYDVDNNYKVIVEPKMRKLEEFEKEYDVIKIDDAQVNPMQLNSTLVKDVHTFTPNYLREWGE